MDPDGLGIHMASLQSIEAVSAPLLKQTLALLTVDGEGLTEDEKQLVTKWCVNQHISMVS